MGGGAPPPYLLFSCRPLLYSLPFLTSLYRLFPALTPSAFPFPFLPPLSSARLPPLPLFPSALMSFSSFSSFCSVCCRVIFSPLPLRGCSFQ